MQVAQIFLLISRILFSLFREFVSEWDLDQARETCWSFFNWFIPIVCEYNVKYLRDIRRVRQNTTLYYDVMCKGPKHVVCPVTHYIVIKCCVLTHPPYIS